MFGDWKVGDPIVAGWYATLTCWDPVEGFFPGCNHWSGTEWRDRCGPVVAHSGPHATAEAAREWADLHDPDQ